MPNSPKLFEPPKVTSVLIGKPPLGHSPFLGMVPYGISVLPFLIAAPALILILFADASGAPGTDATGGTSVLSSWPYGAAALTYLPEERISRLTGLEPLVKKSRPPPGPKNACSVELSATRSVPKVTSPSTLPIGLATALFGHAPGPVALSVASVHVPN